MSHICGWYIEAYTYSSFLAQTIIGAFSSNTHTHTHRQLLLRIYLSVWPSSNNNMIHYHCPSQNHRICVRKDVKRVVKDRCPSDSLSPSYPERNQLKMHLVRFRSSMMSIAAVFCWCLVAVLLCLACHICAFFVDNFSVDPKLCGVSCEWLTRAMGVWAW